MRYRRFVVLPLLLLACGVFAQDAAPVASGSPHGLALQSASASSVHYRDGRDMPRARADGVFKFKDSRAEKAAAPPQGIPGQPAWLRPAPVMGAGKMDANGRPPVDCQRTPMDRQCR
jgi:hypothetical protein